MGLDMLILDENEEEVVYWRKEPAIHDWFKCLAEQKEIEFDKFNCVKVPLEKEDLIHLINDIKNHKLNYEASGFFFGSNSEDVSSEEWHSDMIETIQQVVDDFDSYKNIYYTSWW